MSTIKQLTHAIIISLCLIGQVHFAYAVDQSLIPPAKTTFLNSNGAPLASGKVYFYVPNTLTPKTTYQDFGGATPNTQPVTLDAAGRALIWGTGQYRQKVFDKNNNLIWDAETSAAGSGGSSPTATGDGDLVGTIKPWAGVTAPNQYAFAYGQEVSRTTYSALYTAITSSQTVFCNSGSPVLNGLGDTSNFWIGMSLEVSCVVTGNTTVISKTASSVTMAVNANVTTNTTAIFYPWGRGNGTTTFNLPDLRGVVLAGNNIMGGVASSNMTATYFGTTDPNSAGALGGSQSLQLTQQALPTIASTNYNSVSSSASVTSTVATVATGLVTNGNTGGGGGFVTANSAITSTGTATTAINAVSSLSVFSGGTAIQSTIANAGSGYTNGSQTITVAGGTCTVQPQFTITVSGNVFTGTPALLTAGNCSSAPSNPASTTGGGGTGGTLNVFYTGSPVSQIQPTITTNYIIKVTPDANSATASGVTSLGGMTGDIACGTNVTCTGNTISVSNNIPIVIGGTTITGGTSTGLLYDNAGVVGNSTNSSIQTVGGYQFFGVGDAIATGISRSTATKPTALMLSRLVNWSSINDSTVVDYTTLTAQDSISNQYASFAAYPIMTNTAFDWNHLIGFEDLGIIQGSGTLTNQSSFYSAPTISGTTTNRRGLWISDAGGVGTLTNQYGIYIEALSRGSTNWGLYSNSAGYFGAKLLVGTANANALTVGPNGATNPSFNIDTSTASAATGLNVKSAAAAGGLAVSVLSSGTNENLTIDAKGSGTIGIGGTSTGAITLSRATTASVSLTTPIIQSASTLTFNSNGSTFAGKIDTSQRWMLGPTSVASQPSQILTVTENTAAPAVPPLAASSVMYVYHSDGSATNITLDSYGTGVNPGILFRAARGTAAAPTQSKSGDFLLGLNSYAFNNAGAFQNTTGTGLFGAVLTEDCTTTACGTKWVWYGTTAGTVTLAQKMQVGSGLSVGTTSEPGDGMIYTNAATFMIRTKTSYSNGAGAGGGTITNAPAAGNPTKWIPIDDNGTTRYIPAW